MSALRLLDLDDSLPAQPAIAERLGDGRATRVDLRGLGGALRLWSTRRSWAKLKDRLARDDDARPDGAPFLTLVGSGDFHHVSAARVRAADRSAFRQPPRLVPKLSRPPLRRLVVASD